MSTQIEKLSIARQALEEAKTIQEIVNVKAIGEAIEYYSRKKKMSLEIQNNANIFLADAGIKLGEMLQQMEKNKGTQFVNDGGSKKEPPQKPNKLEDLGITKKESSKSQTLAKNKQKVKEIIDEKIENNEKISVNKIVTELKSSSKQETHLNKEYSSFISDTAKRIKLIQSKVDRFTPLEFSKFLNNDLTEIFAVLRSWKVPEKDCPICKGKGTYIITGTSITCDNCINGKLGDRIK